MRILMRATALILIAVMVCFLGIGYAQVADVLTVTGNASALIQPPVYITNVSYYSESASGNSLNSSVYDATFLNADITLARYSYRAVYSVIAVTVKNRTKRDYAYQDTTGISDVANLSIEVYKDASCTTPLTNANGVVEGKDALGNEQSLTFYVKMSHTVRSASDYNPLLTFNFSTEITKEEEEEVGKNVTNKFLEILNTPADYSTLTSSMDENYDGSRAWTASYIGNVTGSSDDDTLTLYELFEGALTAEINGATVDVTCIVKRENVDGDSSTGDTYTVDGAAYRGCEMTLYVTTANLNDLSYNDYPTVYATVFTKDSADSEWVQLGDTMYEGTAQVVGYVGGTTAGSFDTGTWKSSLTYHGLASRQTIFAIISRYMNS